MISHAFFEDPGFTLELVNRDAVIEMRESMATFRLRFTDQRKQGQNREAIGKHKEGEAIEFNFNLESDNAMEVTSSMVSTFINYFVKYAALFIKFCYSFAKIDHLSYFLIFVSCNLEYSRTKKIEKP